MQKIIQQVQTWQFIAELPNEIEGFSLKVELEEKGTQYCMFTYCNQDWHKSFSVLYDTATREYFARTVIGLTEYFDANFIVNDLKILENLLKNRLKNTLLGLAVFNRDHLDSIVIDKQILEWPYGKELPQTLVGFELFIKPCEPVRVINGSYIIIDYSDFASESNFIIYYNIFRDEFFGEVRLRRTPQMSAVFDAHTLEELQNNISDHLKMVLESMTSELRQ
jgi:hypothetical protein